MDASRFDAWTRRRFGLVAGGFAAAVLGIVLGPEVVARKKRRKKKKKARCRGLGQTCGSPGARCCDNRSCELIDNSLRCCKDTGPCTDNFQCCVGLCFQGSCFVQPLR